MNEIYVLLTNTGTKFTRLIQAFTDAPYNHASLAFDPELKELYSFGRKRPTNPWFAGFIKENVYEGTYSRFPDTRCALLRLKVSARQRAAILQTVRRFQEQKDQYRYNLIGLLGVVFQVEMAPRNSYFCSQFVAEVLRNTGNPLWSRPSALVTPHDFLLHPAFERVYDGLLYDYPLLDRSRVSGIKGIEASAYRVKEQVG